MNCKGKLELTWVGKDERPRLEPRVLVEDPSKSYGDPKTQNMLIFGDNLLALRAIEEMFAESIKCVYVDPPFNTGQALENYEDGLEHSIWLTLMRDRFEILHRLLSKDGTLAVHIDDNELGYLVVMLDELFGRQNRMYIVTFKQGSATGHKAINPGCVTTTNYVVLYAKDKAYWSPNKVYTGRQRDKRYGQFIVNVGDQCHEWRITSLTKAFSASLGISEKDARTVIKETPEKLDAFVLQHAQSVIRTARPDYDAVSEAARAMIDDSKRRPDVILRLARTDHSDMYFQNGERILFYSDKLKSVDGKYVAGEPLTTLWDDILSNNLHNEGGVEFPKGKKPEALIKRVLDLATGPDDWVLDSFGGSGTTGSVAHKMRRRWIMVELREHCHTHIIPRLKSVIDGTDKSGVTEAVAWKGGGGFKYFRLAESLLVRDKELSTKDHPVYVINPRYDETLLIRGICKIAGFKYRNDGRLHGISSENRFLHVTTRLVTQMYLDSLGEDIAKNQSLVIYCTRRVSKLTVPDNIEIRKIPRDLLEKCDFEEDK